MPRPGIEVTSRAERARRGAPTDTGAAFIVAPTSTSGRVGEVVELSRLSDVADLGLGTRSGAGVALYDALEVAFAEGVATAYVGVAATGAVADLEAALALLSADLGPGQVAAYGYDDVDLDAVNGLLLDHAAANNRTAILDVAAADDTAAEATARAATIGTRNNADRGLLFAGRLTAPGVAGSTATRAVPMSAGVLGLIARNDAAAGVGDAPAGDRGFYSYVLGLETGSVFTDAERTALTLAGVNVSRMAPGSSGPQLYGFRGASDDETWRFGTNQRLRMALVARMSAAAEQYLFRTLDGQGRLLGNLRNSLRVILDAEYQRGSLFGATADEAYDVDVSDAVNRPETLRDGEVYATVLARFSPFTELARIDLVKAAVGGPAF